MKEGPLNGRIKVAELMCIELLYVQVQREVSRGLDREASRDTVTDLTSTS
jgi:hypothetical protein